MLLKILFMPMTTLLQLSRTFHHTGVWNSSSPLFMERLCGCRGLGDQPLPLRRAFSAESLLKTRAKSCLGQAAIHNKCSPVSLKSKRTRLQSISTSAWGKSIANTSSSEFVNKGDSLLCKEDEVESNTVEEKTASCRSTGNTFPDGRPSEALQTGNAQSEGESRPSKGVHRVWLKGTSVAALETPYLELNLKPIQEKYGGLRVRQHVNPLKASLRFSEVPAWENVFQDPSLPLHLDIGSGMGRYLLLLAQRDHGAHNFLGLEIRKQLVDRSNFWANELQLKNIHFIMANANVALQEILTTYPGRLVLVTILCPDPHFKKKHHKRRVVQEGLVKTIAQHLVPGGKLFLQSDVEEVALDMEHQFSQHGGDLLELAHEHRDPLTGHLQRWLQESPLQVPTEREVHVTSKGGTLFRLLFTRK